MWGIAAAVALVAEISLMVIAAGAAIAATVIWGGVWAGSHIGSLVLLGCGATGVATGCRAHRFFRKFDAFPLRGLATTVIGLLTLLYAFNVSMAIILNVVGG